MRANDSVQYIAPNRPFGPGLCGNVTVATGEHAMTNKYLGGRIGYAGPAFNVAVAYSRTEVDTSGAVMFSNFDVGASGRAAGFRLSGYFGRIESKRTALYATTASIRNDGTVYGVSPTGSVLTRGNNSSGVEIGVHHLF